MLALLSLSACDSQNDYPNDYIGFGRKTESYTLSKQEEERDIDIRIIAGSKSEKEREVALSTNRRPDAPEAFRLLDRRIIIPAHKKTATARIRVYPKKLRKREYIVLLCSPKDKDIQQTQLTLQLLVE